MKALWLLLLLSGVAMGDQFQVSERITRFALSPCHWPTASDRPSADADDPTEGPDLGEPLVITSDEITELDAGDQRTVSAEKGGVTYTSLSRPPRSPIWWQYDQEQKAWHWSVEAGQSGGDLRASMANRVEEVINGVQIEGSMKAAPPEPKPPEFKEIYFKTIKVQHRPQLAGPDDAFTITISFADSSTGFTTIRSIRLIHQGTNLFLIGATTHETTLNEETGWYTSIITIPESLKIPEVTLTTIGFAAIIESNAGIDVWARCVGFTYEVEEDDV